VVPRRKKPDDGGFYGLKNWFLDHKVIGVILFVVFVLLMGMTLFNQCVSTRQNIKTIVDGSSPNKIENSSNSYESQESDGYKTVWFDKSDPSIEFWRKFDLPKQVGAPIYVGNCPMMPCVSFEITNLSLPPRMPFATIAIGVISDGIVSPERTFNIDIRIEKGCGGSFNTHEYDFVFEIVDDRVTSLTGVIAFFPGKTIESGFRMDSIGCK